MREVYLHSTYMFPGSNAQKSINSFLIARSKIELQKCTC
jgi:hypothetical protein